MNYGKYSWDPGVRVWAGYQWGCDGWESNIVYTYFKTTGSDDEIGNVTPPQLGLGAVLGATEILSTEFITRPVTEAEIELKLRYQTLDLLLSRPFCISRSLILKPHFGFRALWLDRHQIVSYEDTAENYLTVELDSNLDGYGLHGGVDGDIKLCRFFGCGLISMRGLLRGTIVACQPNTRNIQRTTTLQLAEVNTKDKDNCIGVTGLHLGAGISWENCFNCFYTLINLGYEFNQYFNLPQVRRYTFNPETSIEYTAPIANACPSNNGNVLLHGLTISAEIRF